MGKQHEIKSENGMNGDDGMVVAMVKSKHT